jgi:hypothetical protein
VKHTEGGGKPLKRGRREMGGFSQRRKGAKATEIE